MFSSIRRLVPSAFLALVVLSTPTQGIAQQSADDELGKETFLRPPPEIAEAVMAPRHLNLTLGGPSPDGMHFLNELSDGPPTMAMFALPFYRLGGLQIDWRANRARQLTTRSGVGLRVTDRDTGRTLDIEAPDGARVSSAVWSPDGSKVGFLAHFDDASYVYVADPRTGNTQRVADTPVLATLSTSLTWTPDSRGIVTVLVPESRGAPPARPEVPTGPQVRMTTPETNRVRTYPDLLQDPFEKELLQFYGTGQLAIVDVERRRATPLGEPAMIEDVSVSPDGAHLLVERMQRPFSYIVPTRQFGGSLEVWSAADGTMLALVAENDVNEGTPDDTTNGGGADPQPRDITWRADGSLSYLQMAPRPDDDEEPTEGEGRRGGRRDHVVQWTPPFDESSKQVIYENDTRLASVRYAEAAGMLFLSEQRGDNGHDYVVFLDDTDTKHTLWRGRRVRFTRGRTPTLLTTTLASGVDVVRTTPDASSAFLSGTAYHDDPTAEGPQSYIDRIDIRSGDKTRVYESENNGVYERLLAVLSDDVSALLVTRESPTDVPDSYFRDVTSGTLRQLTENTDYTPDLTNAQRMRYAVQRADGLEFAVDVTLPQDRQPGERLPGMIWFYPREYTDQGRYDEATREQYNKNAFPNLRARSMDVLVRRGYAVIEPDAPIIGESGRMNDNYIHDLRNNLAATLDFLEKEEIIDRSRMGVGGHSYGAFSTVNAMVHTPFFKAGIAGDGNFNRTLTPFSFQSERRSIWQNRDLYYSMSPLFYANNLTGALLMYTGEHDQNVGTFPIHSWRLFESLESLGKTASLYVYPFEDHGPATSETLLDLWARWSAWLDEHVKNAGTDEDKITADASAGGP